MATYAQLSQVHPEYSRDYWQRCRALYAGGRALLADAAVLQAVFPKHHAEHDQVYAERLRRACYIPYPGEIIDQIVAAVMSDPIAVESEDADADFFDRFVADCSRPGGKKQGLTELLRDQLLTALQCGLAWVLTDLPRPGDASMAPETLAEEEKAGLRDVYAVECDPCSVIDWEEDDSGELSWVLVHRRTARRSSLETGRTQTTEEWTHYVADPAGATWTRYAVTYQDIEGKRPKPTDEIAVDAEGKLTSPRVPVLKFSIPDGLWAMNKMESIARAHFNLRNATSWGELKTLFPLLVAFIAASDNKTSDPIAEDQNRATNQRVGPGYVMNMAAGDRIEYVGPNPGAFDAAHKDLSNLRDEMHRVVVQMAMSVDNSGAALGRSGLSKQADKDATIELLRAYGRHLREHAEDIAEMAQAARGDEVTKWKVTGAEKFDQKAVEGLIKDNSDLEMISIPSARFQQLRKMQLAKRYLGDDATPEDLETIKKELEANISAESFEAPPPVSAARPFPGLEGEGAVESGEPVAGQPAHPGEKGQAPSASGSSAKGAPPDDAEKDRVDHYGPHKADITPEQLAAVRVKKIETIAGLEVWTVSGDKIRNDVDVDFTNGGNGGRYSYVPTDEVWTEAGHTPLDTKATACHEIVEFLAMRDEGLDYDGAHDRANEIEMKVRQMGDKGAGQTIAALLAGAGVKIPASARKTAKA